MTVKGYRLGQRGAFSTRAEVQNIKQKFSCLSVRKRSGLRLPRVAKAYEKAWAVSFGWCQMLSDCA
jgi:hypothetical protein